MLYNSFNELQNGTAFYRGWYADSAEERKHKTTRQWRVFENYADVCADDGADNDHECRAPRLQLKRVILEGPLRPVFLCEFGPERILDK